MGDASFEATVLAGHTGAAVEVPFHPGVRWTIGTVALRPGRRGYPVRVGLAGEAFENHVIPRSKCWWLLLPEDRLAGAGIDIGEQALVQLSPRVTETPR